MKLTYLSLSASSSVYPAAGFVSEARALGIRTCEINLELSDNAEQFDERRYGIGSYLVRRTSHFEVKRECEPAAFSVLSVFKFARLIYLHPTELRLPSGGG
jgi:hypothetical protein